MTGAVHNQTNPTEPQPSTHSPILSSPPTVRDGVGGTGHEDGLLRLIPPQTPPHNTLLIDKATATCPAILAASLPVAHTRRPRRLPTRSAVDTVHPRGYLGVDPEGGAQKEDITHEEEAQADGGQGIEGRQLSVQVPGVRRDQADAPPLPALHSK